MNAEHRIETDSMGEMQVPFHAYYGAQTARAAGNFDISPLRFSRPFLRALGLIKKHAAATIFALGGLSENLGWAIQKAAQEVADGKWDDQFIVDVFQTGSGTSTNMNANEVIANRAIEILGGQRGDRSVHPNDHVNRGQSSNDVIPTTIHIAALDQITNKLLPELNRLHAALTERSRAFEDVLKIGRTHLQDATPIRLGQEFSGYAAQVRLAIGALMQLDGVLGEVALGGTAVGTGINTHPEFAPRTIAALAAETGLNFRETRNHFSAQGGIEALIHASSALKTLAVSLVKIANDIRWLASGPRCGLGEIRLPATQPGSSIMPGKVNPVMCEMLIQVGAQVIGNDATITFAGTFGNFELNTMLPVAAFNLLQSIDLLARGTHAFTERCVVGIVADRDRCALNLDRSLALVTALVPVIGYDQAAKIAHEAHRTGHTLKESAATHSGLGPDKLNQLLDPATQVGGSRSSDR
jgi:fumarate hydratase class II